jgi:hypothetical protein
MISRMPPSTTLEVSRSFNPFASDHVPFIDAGVPAVLTIEGEDSSNNLIHTAGDTFELVDPDLAMQILRMNMGAWRGAWRLACRGFRKSISSKCINPGSIGFYAAMDCGVIDLARTAGGEPVRRGR